MVRRGSSQLQSDSDSDDQITGVLRSGKSAVVQPRRNWAVRPGMWADVCLRLQCPGDTPVKILSFKDLKKVEAVLQDLRKHDQVVVIMPDQQDCEFVANVVALDQEKILLQARSQALGPGWLEPLGSPGWIHPSRGRSHQGRPRLHRGRVTREGDTNFKFETTV